MQISFQAYEDRSLFKHHHSTAGAVALRLGRRTVNFVPRRCFCARHYAGHVERRGTVAFRVDGRRRSGRPRLRWEDCVKRDLAGVGGEWRRRARDRGEWRRRARDRGEWRTRARDRGEWRTRVRDGEWAVKREQ